MRLAKNNGTISVLSFFKKKKSECNKPVESFFLRFSNFVICFNQLNVLRSLITAVEKMFVSRLIFEHKLILRESIATPLYG